MTDTQPFTDRSQGFKLAFFIIGLSLPLVGLAAWLKNAPSRKQQVDQAHDTTMEDSFPASDPPSAW